MQITLTFSVFSAFVCLTTAQRSSQRPFRGRKTTATTATSTTTPQNEQSSAETIPNFNERTFFIPTTEHLDQIQASTEKYENGNEERSTRTPDIKPIIPILRFEKSMSSDGTSYKSRYETGNNIISEENGYMKNMGDKDLEGLVQYGFYSYISPEGNHIHTSYQADEDGFQVKGSHIPTAPPMPEYIKKSLELIKQINDLENNESNYTETYNRY